MTPIERACLIAKGCCLNYKVVGYITADLLCLIYKKHDPTFKCPFYHLYNNAAIVNNKEVFIDNKYFKGEFTKEEAIDK